MTGERGAHWSELPERGDVAGLKFMYGAYRRLGRPVFALLLYPVVAYFYVTAGAARRASRSYLAHVRRRLRAERRPPLRAGTFAHLLEFGRAILDKGMIWSGAFRADDVTLDDPAAFERCRPPCRGALFIGSHLGNVEVLRAYAERTGVKVNALVSTRNSPNLNSLLSSIEPNALDSLIEIDSLGPDTIVKLEDKIRAGEHVAIAADRISVRHRERSVRVPFLGEPAAFPEGPFILADLLACPVYLVFCLRIGKTYRLYLEPFADPLVLPRERRRAALEEAVARYAERLEAYCLLAPTQWFNFFDFWQPPSGTGQ